MPGLLGTSLTPDELWDTIKSVGRGINLGSTSGLLGGPVDMATMLLNNPGMIHPGLLGAQGLGIEKPVMGSKWIESKLQPAGLLPQRQGNWQEGVGELASTFINPMTAAAVAGPKLYAAEQRAIENAMAPTTLNKQTGAIVWHGSPHKFDKFDSNKIGTGEGAQAYGHGLYLAESPAVAGQYQKTLSQNNPTVGGEVLSSAIEKSQLSPAAKDVLRGYAKNGDVGLVNNWAWQGKPEYIEAQKFLKQAKDNPGSLYKVDLPDEHIAKMLDWDKPLSKQHPDVQAALAKTKNKQLRAVVDYASSPYSTPGLEGEVKTMGEAIKLLGMNASPAKGSAMLAKQGIPGIRYLDGGSRGTGAGTSNFVVFPGNEDILKILERNGQPVGGLLGR